MRVHQVSTHPSKNVVTRLVSPAGTKGKKKRHLTHHPYLGNELQVERAGDLQLASDSAAYRLDLGASNGVEVLGRGDQRRVARVDPRVLHVLAHGQAEYLSFLCDCVHVYLLWKITQIRKKITSGFSCFK